MLESQEAARQQRAAAAEANTEGRVHVPDDAERTRLWQEAEDKRIAEEKERERLEAEQRKQQRKADGAKRVAEELDATPPPVAAPAVVPAKRSGRD